jgi:hypothetical protein
LAVLWHWAQLVVLDGALAWMSATVGITEKSGFVWQVVQAAPVLIGMWLVGMALTVKSLRLA